MAAPISLREDFDGPMLRALARSEKAGSVTRRILALVTIYEGGARADAAKLVGVGLQTIRDWVLRFNAKGPDGLIDGESTGRPPKLNDEQRLAILAMVEAGPIPAIHEVVRWRLIDLAQWVFAEYGVSVTKQILSRELRALAPGSRVRGSRRGRAITSMTRRLSRPLKKSPRPPGGHRGGQWRQAPRAVAPRRSPHRPKEQDHATLGVTRDASFCPERSENRLGLHLRRHLSRIRQGGGSRPAVLQHQGDGIASPGDCACRGTRRPRRRVRRPDGVACHREAAIARKHDAGPLPSKSPELNPVENIWQYMRDNWLSNRIFAGYEDIVDHCCFNWNKLVDRHWLIMSIGLRQWAHGLGF